MPRKDCSNGQLPDASISGSMLPFRVFVADLPCDIAIYSTLKSDCVAVGEYRAKHIEVRGADALSAADAWIRAAAGLPGE
jgi:hypothetical protein